MLALICRSLTREYKLTAPSPALLDEFRFMETVPELPGLALTPVEIAISEEHGFCFADFPDGSRVEGSPEGIIAKMHGITFEDAVRFDRDAPILHGATVVIADKRLLLVGHKGAGKTTLALHLVANGHRVEGDEHLLVGSTGVIARPRTLRAKPGTLALLPGLAEKAQRSPFVTAWDGTPVCALSPAIGGVDWVIRQGPLDAIVFLTANYGGRSFADRLPKDLAFRRLVPEVVRWPSNVAAASARLWRVLAGAQLYELLLGDLAPAEWHLKQIAGT